MGKMKDIFMALVQEQRDDEYQEVETNQWVHQDIQCPNCYNISLFKNKDNELNCDVCGQNFIEVNGALRFE
jgi:ribosomal protein S27E